jgi:hypothetical protein
MPEILRSPAGRRSGDHPRRMLRLSLEHPAFPEQQISATDGETLPLIAPEGQGSSFELLLEHPRRPGDPGSGAAGPNEGADRSVFPTEGRARALADQVRDSGCCRQGPVHDHSGIVRHRDPELETNMLTNHLNKSLKTRDVMRSAVIFGEKPNDLIENTYAPLPPLGLS